MPIKISVTNPVNKILSVTHGTIKRTAQVTIPEGVFSDAVKISCIRGNLGEILEKITGCYSKDDLRIINKYKNEYSVKTKDELNIIHRSIKERFISYVLSGIVKKSEKFEQFEYSPENITKDIQCGIKDYTLKMYALKNLINENRHLLGVTPYSDWLEYNYQFPNRRISGNFYDHPMTKIIKNTGELIGKDFEKVKNLENRFGNMDISEIWREKCKLLNDAEKQLKGSSADFMFSYSDNELALMKENLIKYKALNNIQTRHGYYTKALESLLYSHKYKYENGEYINGIGIIADKFNIEQKNVILTFGDIYNRHSLRLYNTECLREGEKFLNELPDVISADNLNSLNKKSQEIIDNTNKGLISEICFEVIDKTKLSNILKHSSNYKNPDEILGDNKYYYYISEYKNFKKQEYPASAKKLGIYLLKYLKNRQAYPLFLLAEPYGSSHSPVSLYLRMGFEPVFETKEDILNNMNLNRSEYKGKMVYMFAKDYKRIGSLTDRMFDYYFKNSSK